MEYSIKNKDLRMKKILFCAAVAALATACTNEDDLVMNQDNSRAQGLTFDVTLAEGATTRGEIWKDENGTYPFFWYAETDRINVHALNVEAGTSNANELGVATGTDAWTLSTGGAASYKATKSAGAGQFTAADDENMLTLMDYDADDVAGTTATIVATYGENIKVKSVESKVDEEGETVPGELAELVLSTVTAGNATQTVARANAVDAPMYSVSTAIKEKAYNSFGEKANLQLVRPFPVIRFTTKNTKDYIKDFGPLKSVELTALGTKKEDGSQVDVAASYLAYAEDKEYTVIGDEVGFEAAYQAAATPEKVTVNLTDGTWTDDDAVYMTVAPVNREGFRKKNQKEPLKVVYTFDKITFTLDPTREGAAEFEKAIQTSNDWSATDANGNPNAITPMPALDINNYNYLVTNVKTSNDRTLIVLKGNFKDIFNKDGEVIWSAAAGGKANVTEFKKVISNVALTNEELATIKKFTNVTDWTLSENTAIPANTFTAAQAAAIINLNLPKVTSIDEKFIANDNTKAFAALETLIMPAYKFEDATVNKALFNDNVKATLKTLDMSGVASMMPKFGIERTMVFTGYTKLEKVTVQDNIIVSPSGFAGCVALKTIIGKLDISDASNAFEMETTANAVLKSVELNGTVIPANAFNNCTALETVTYNGSTIVPTAIGANAFESATAMKYMDLSKAATIGAGAFKSSGITSTNAKVNTMTVGATELTKDMFNDCKALKMVKFTDATKITGADVFAGATGVIQIKFEKVITLADAADGTYDNVFATPANIDFWTNPAQPGVNGNVFTLSYKVTGTTGTKPVSYTFKSIQKKLD